MQTEITNTGENNQEWLTIKQAALVWGIESNSLVKNIIKYKSIISAELKGGGKQGSKLWITKEGLFQLRNIVDKNRYDLDSHVAKYKKDVAIQATKISDIDKLLQISQNIMTAFVGLNERVEKLESTPISLELVEKVEKLEEENKKYEVPKTMAQPQRDFLVERVRNYARLTEIPHFIIHTKLNKSVGKAGVHLYNMQDYKLAINILQAMYKEASLNWK